jgi:hypothetical protein
MMVGDNLNAIQLQQLVDRTIAQGDKDFDGKLSKEEFTKVDLSYVFLLMGSIISDRFPFHCRW